MDRLSGTGADLCRLCHAEFLGGPAADAGVLRSYKGLSRHQFCRGSAQYFSACADTGPCHVLQIYQAGPHGGSGRDEPGLCGGGQGKGRSGIRDFVEKRVPQCAAAAYHHVWTVRWQSAWWYQCGRSDFFLSRIGKSGGFGHHFQRL